MDNTTLLINRITVAQHNAAVGVILPLLMSKKKNFDSETEWKLFQPLSVLFAQSFSPKTAYDYPLLFLTWVLEHPNQSGMKDYIDHLVKAANAATADNQAGLDEQQSLTAAINSLAQHGISII